MLTGVPPHADADSLAVVDARRHVDGDLLALHLAPASAADVAGLLGHATVAIAHVAHRGPDHLPEGRTGDRAQLSGALALGAGLDGSAGLGAVAVAVLAPRDRLVGDLHRRSACGLRQVDLGGHGDVATLGRTPGPGAAAAEDPSEGASPTAAEEGVKDVGDRAEGVEVGRIAAAAQALVPVAVVGGAPVGVGEHLVGLGRLLELGLGIGIVTVDVGVQFARQPPKRLLYLVVAGV